MARRSAAIGFILATLAIDALGFGVVVPVIPSLVERLSGGSASNASIWVGSLVATFAATQFLASPVLGALSDRFGRRPVLLLSLSGITANYLLLAWAPSLPWLFAGRLIAGATAANVAVATAYIADVTPPERRAARFGLIGATFGAGFVLGPALGGVLGAYGLRLPFLASAGLAFVNLLYGALVLPESLPHARRRPFDWRRANALGALGALAADPVRARLAAAWCCAWIGLGALQSSFVLSTALRFGWGPHENGLVLAAVGAVQAVVQGLLVRRVLRRAGERRAAVGGFVLTALGYAAFAFAPTGGAMFLGVVLQGLGAVANPALRGLVSARAGPERQGEAMGGLSAVEGLAAIVAPPLTGAVFAHFSAPGAVPYFPGAPFLLGAASCLLAAALVRGVRVPVPAEAQA